MEEEGEEAVVAGEAVAVEVAEEEAVEGKKLSTYFLRNL